MIGFVISMYNEHATVAASIRQIKGALKNESPVVIVVHSDNGADSTDLAYIKTNADHYHVLPNLGSTLPKHQIAATSLCRNYGAGFSFLYSTGAQFKYVVGMCGDTLVSDAMNFERRWGEMQKSKLVGFVSQALGQNFHAADADPANGKEGGRFQGPGSTDIMPQLFMIEGSVASKFRMFATIPVVNRFTSEQCLGDELMRVMETSQQFNTLIGRFAETCYGYSDGISYHSNAATTVRPSGKKYTDDFHKPDFRRSEYPVGHSVGGKKVPPDGDAQPRMSGPVLLASSDAMPIGLSCGVGKDNGANGDFGPYIQYCGEGLPPSFSLDFTNDLLFSCGNVHPHSALMLFTLALNQRPKTIVETGTYYGYSTLFLAKACEIWGGGKVHTIDPEDTLVHPSVLKNPYIDFRKGRSEQLLPGLLEEVKEVHFAFIDSWKRIAYKEFKLIEPYLAVGGIAVFHDTQFLDTGESLYKQICSEFADRYDTMLFCGRSNTQNPHKYFGNADDRGLFVIRKKETDPFLRVSDYDSALYGNKLLA